MKIFSWNVNGLRAVIRHGFWDWVRKADADIICLQEIKSQPQQLLPGLVPEGDYHFYSNSANKPGYSGVAVYSRVESRQISSELGLKRFDSEGRFLKLDFSDFTLINLYLPHGGRQKENLKYKLEVYSTLLKYLLILQQTQDKIILVGDFNIAHEEIDLARPKENKNNIMFTPEERQQLDKLLALGFTDTFRRFNRDPGHYTWFPYFAGARERNLGWRIDYAFTSKSLLSKLKNAFILPEVTGSDHCPIGIEA